MKHNMNKTLTALAAVMLAGLAAPMATADHTTDPCAAPSNTLATSEPTGYGTGSLDSLAHAHYKTSIVDGQTKTLYFSADKEGLVLQVFQKVGDSCVRVGEDIVRAGDGSPAQVEDQQFSMTNPADDPANSVSDDDFFIVISSTVAPDPEEVLGSIAYRLWRQA